MFISSKHVKIKTIFWKEGLIFYFFGRVPRYARVGVLRATLRFGATLRFAPR
ncbi:MAG: hypothetical protein RML94_15200 [Bacteroidia bacterium]|nr:hypothetical protein [Bacteroidia bacterium]